MSKDNTDAKEEPAATNWEDLRAQAAKLGITLSELQQRQRQKQLKREKKAGSANPPSVQP